MQILSLFLDSCLATEAHTASTRVCLKNGDAMSILWHFVFFFFSQMLCCHVLFQVFLPCHSLPSGVPYLPEPGTLPSWASPVIATWLTKCTTSDAGDWRNWRNWQVVPHQVQRDLEQLEYLVARGTANRGPETACRGHLKR